VPIADLFKQTGIGKGSTANPMPKDEVLVGWARDFLAEW